MVDQDELEKKLWHLRDMYNNPEVVYEHTHPKGYRFEAADGGFSCFIEQEILFKLGYSSRTILQVDMGNVYNHLLGICVATAYGRTNPSTGARQIIDYLKKKSTQFPELEMIANIDQA